MRIPPAPREGEGGKPSGKPPSERKVTGQTSKSPGARSAGPAKSSKQPSRQPLQAPPKGGREARGGAMFEEGGGSDFRVKMTGMSLTLKFMITISVMIGLLVLVFFIATLLITSKSLNEANLTAGSMQVRLFAGLGKSYIENVQDPQFLEGRLRSPTVRQYLSDYYQLEARTRLNIDDSFEPINDPVMEGFRLDQAEPGYETIAEFEDDIARACANQYGFLNPEEAWRVPEGTPGVHFRWTDRSERVATAFLRFLTEEMPDERDFPADINFDRFMQYRRFSYDMLRNAPHSLRERLQRQYHEEFRERYVQDLVQNPRITGVIFTTTGSVGVQEVEEFREPEGISGTQGGNPVDDNVYCKDHSIKVDKSQIPVRQFRYTTSVQTVDSEGRQDITEYQALVFFDYEKLQEGKNKLLLFLSLIAVLAVVIGICVSYFLAHGVTRPIMSLVEDVIVIAKGDFAHRTRVKTRDEIGVLAKTIDRMSEGLMQARNIAEQYGQVKHDLNIAEEVVIHLLPDTLPKIYGYDVYAFYNPSKDVGGDYYDFYQIDANHVGMIVADVSGKGIPGAMVMTMARTVIRYEAQKSLSPRETFIHANRHIARDIKRGMFVTSFYLVLNTQTGEMLVSSAGHNPMVVWRAKTGKIDLINPNGIALGFDKGPIFERTIKEEKVQLNSGDRVVLYTDGVVEAMSPDGEEYGDDRFYKLVEDYPDANSNQLTNIVVKDVMSHQSTGEQHDDITVVTFKLH